MRAAFLIMLLVACGPEEEMSGNYRKPPASRFGGGVGSKYAAEYRKSAIQARAYNSVGEVDMPYVQNADPLFMDYAATPAVQSLIEWDMVLSSLKGVISPFAVRQLVSQPGLTAAGTAAVKIAIYRISRLKLPTIVLDYMCGGIGSVTTTVPSVVVDVDRDCVLLPEDRYLIGVATSDTGLLAPSMSKNFPVSSQINIMAGLFFKNNNTSFDGIPTRYDGLVYDESLNEGALRSTKTIVWAAALNSELTPVSGGLSKFIY